MRRRAQAARRSSAHGRKLRGLAAQTIAALSADATGAAARRVEQVVPLLARLTADPTDDGDEGRGVAFDALTALVNCAADGAAVECPRAALGAPAPRVSVRRGPGLFWNAPSSRLSSSPPLSPSTRRQMLLAADASLVSRAVEVACDDERAGDDRAGTLAARAARMRRRRARVRALRLLNNVSASGARARCSRSAKGRRTAAAAAARSARMRRLLGLLRSAAPAGADAPAADDDDDDDDDDDGDADGDRWAHAAGVVAGVTSRAEGRALLTRAPRDSLLQRLLPQLHAPHARARRRGVAIALRNCCFDRDAHYWLSTSCACGGAAMALCDAGGVRSPTAGAGMDARLLARLARRPRPAPRPSGASATSGSSRPRSTRCCSRAARAARVRAQSVFPFVQETDARGGSPRRRLRAARRERQEGPAPTPARSRRRASASPTICAGPRRRAHADADDDEAAAGGRRRRRRRGRRARFGRRARGYRPGARGRGRAGARARGAARVHRAARRRRRGAASAASSTRAAAAAGAAPRWRGSAVAPPSSEAPPGPTTCSPSFRAPRRSRRSRRPPRTRGRRHAQVVHGAVHRADCCAMCGRAGAMRCARCQRVRYCSGPCQVQHWKKGGHRKECGKQQGGAHRRRAAVSGGRQRGRDSRAAVDVGSACPCGRP